MLHRIANIFKTKVQNMVHSRSGLQLIYLGGHAQPSTATEPVLTQTPRQACTSLVMGLSKGPCRGPVPPWGAPEKETIHWTVPQEQSLCRCLLCWPRPPESSLSSLLRSVSLGLYKTDGSSQGGIHQPPFK